MSEDLENKEDEDKIEIFKVEEDEEEDDNEEEENKNKNETMSTNSAPSTYEQLLEAYKIEISKVLDKSAALFEKQLIYVAAGTIAASVYIVEKFFKEVHYGIWLMILCWFFCGLVIIINLFSHHKAVIVYTKTINELNNNSFDSKIANKRNKIIKGYNIASLIAYSVGVIALTVYMSINYSRMNIALPVAEKVNSNSATTPKATDTIKTNKDTIKINKNAKK